MPATAAKSKTPRQPASSTRKRSLAPHSDGTPTLLAAKLNIPVPPRKLVLRCQLMAALDQAVLQPVTIICAPAGYGKTTWLSRWATETDRSVAWVSLDRSDDTPTRFWAYVVAALQRVQAGVDLSGVGLLDTFQEDAGEPFLIAIINQIGSNNRDVVLVLDDFQVIKSPGVLSGMAYLIEHLPECLRLVLSGREFPALGLSRLRARGTLAEYSARDLSWSPGDVATFLEHADLDGLTEDDVLAIHEKTEGWATGVQLLSLALKGQANIPGFIARLDGSHRLITDYLVEDVLSQQPEVIQAFLLMTSVLDPLNAALCAAVIGRAEMDCQAMLEALERANLFIVALDDQRVWYRYHHLFANVLRSKLRHTTAGATITGLYRKASVWYDENGWRSEAIQTALDGYDFERAAMLILTSRESLQMRDELPTLLRWVDALPETMVRLSPELCLAKAFPLGVSGRFAEAENYLQCAEAVLRAEVGVTRTGEEQRSLLGELAAVRAMIMAVEGKGPAVMEFIHQAVGLLPEDRLYLRGMLQQTSGGVYFLNNDLDTARHVLKDALDSQLKLGIPNMICSGRCNLGRVERTMGHLRDADRILHDALHTYPDSSSVDRPMLSMAYVEMGHISYEWNRITEAQGYLTKALRTSKYLYSPLDIGETYLCLGRIKHACGDDAGAVQAFGQALGIVKDWGIRTHVPVPCLKLWKRSGQLDLLLGSADDSWQDATVRRRPTLVETYRLQMAAALLFIGGRVKEAQMLLERLLMDLGDGGPAFEIEVLILRSLVASACGECSQALLTLNRALTLAEPEGYIRIFVDEEEPMLKLLTQARVVSRYKAYIDRLIAAFGAPCQAVKVDNVTLTERLSEREVELLQWVSTGLSTRDVAEQLVITVETVRTHLTNINAKLQTHSRLQAVQRARELKLL